MIGKCDICDCTDDHACAIPGGCAWANPEQTLCSACVGWAKLKASGHGFGGIFDHDLVPVLDVVPVKVFLVPLGREALCSRIDLRRVPREALERLAFQAAPGCGGIAQDSASTPYVIPLNKELGKAIGFNQKEISVGGMGMLQRVFLPAAVSAVATGVFQEVIKLVTAANFPNAQTITASNFDADAVSDRATELTSRNVPNYYRYGLLKPVYYGALTKDNQVQAYYASNSTDPLQRRRLPQLGGFDFIDETTGFPLTGQTATENLVGFFGSQEALLMAARLPATPPEGSTDVQFENVIEPITKFPMQFQFFYLPVARKWVIAVATLFGVLAGPPPNLTRIQSS